MLEKNNFVIITNTMFLLIISIWGILIPHMTVSELSESEQQIIAAQRKFASNIYQLLPKDENVVFSPFSAHLILSLLIEGASGSTFDEMKSVLALSGTKADFAKGYRAINAMIEPKKNAHLESANKIYASPLIKINPSFTQQAVISYKSEVENIDFENAKTVDRINNWISQKTHGEIKNCLSKDSFDKDTRVVLINALYFASLWKYTFKLEKTKMNFSINSKESQMVEQMSIEANINITRGKNFEMIEFPYADEDYLLKIILPNIDSSLEEIENDIGAILSNSNNYETHLEVVGVLIPKFEIEFKVDLNPILQKLGMQKAFGSANFHDLTDFEDVYLSSIFQKSIIKVTENGTVAAAVTVGITSTRSFRRLVIEVNRPFQFVLMHKSLQSPIFMGRVKRFKK